MNRRRWGWAAGLVLLIAGTVLAGVNLEGFSELSTAPAVWRTVASGAEDSLDAETPVDAQGCDSNPKILLSPVFTTAGATAYVSVELYHTSTGSWCGTAYVGTFTAASDRNVAGEYPATAIGVSTRGARYWDVRVHDVSAGSMKLRAWNYASYSTPAE